MIEWMQEIGRKNEAVLGGHKLPFTVVFSSLIRRLRERFLLRGVFCVP